MYYLCNIYLHIYIEIHQERSHVLPIIPRDSRATTQWPGNGRGRGPGSGPEAST
jgi:hypothetical protein